MRPRRYRTRAPLPASRTGFTLVEGVLAAGLAALMMLAIITFFGDFMQRFGHQDDTLSGAHEAQLLLEWLRRDLEHADGRADDPTENISSSSETGTTWPKYWYHAFHEPGSSELLLLRRSVDQDGEGLPTDHPAGAALTGGGAEAAAVRAQLSRIENAVTWVAPSEDPSSPRFLVVNVRNGDKLERVVYSYTPASQVVERVAPDGRRVRIASPALRSFLAVPYVEIVHAPDSPDFTPRIVKTWVEVRFSIRAEETGKRMTTRDVGFSTRLFPMYLNQSMKSEWNR